jgi:peptidoglycan LD-endopeptidase CwlK
MPAKLSQRSLDRLNTCEADLVRVVRRAEELSPYDFTVLEGHRTRERQAQLYKEGKTQIDGVSRLGKHNYTPSRAVDIAPYPVSWDLADHWRFDVLAGCMFAAAAELGVSLRWGGDFNGDGKRKPGNFLDLPHFELS